MFHKEIAKDVYSVGVLNPNLRVFDIVMSTEFGTSYNAYLVKGSEKTALIETSHKHFLDYLMENIQDVAELSSIDYLVMNHNEPDHSGAIAKLLEVIPNLQIIASQAGALYLKNITNRTDLNLRIVKNGETLDLGGKTLTFLSAPFLHWPDSMFTWLEEDKVLFTCDFLGSHYCEPQAMDSSVAYPEDYETAFRGYYDAIFGPFKPYVLKGLDIMDSLPVEIAAPSHGPVLTKGNLLPAAMEKYREWSTPVKSEQKVIPIFYCTAYGNTEQLADAMAKGINRVFPDAAVETYNIIDHDLATLGGIMNESDAFLIGSPTLNRDAVPPVYMLLAHADAINIQKRPVAVFGYYGWSGEAVANIRTRLQCLKTKLFAEDFRVIFVPSEEDLKRAEEFGAAFAESLK
ncbi:MAG: FprA family A-type flavoprotein [Clostridiales bacterium]|nr:FprA family A-type flavoprotein [Clostridiales bacterium]